MKTILSFSYLRFHYVDAVSAGFVLWRDLLWFIYNFFSVEILFKTLFYPWRRLSEEYRPGFDPANWFASSVVNLIMRGVGVLIRLPVILTGLVAVLAGVLVGLILFIVWLLLPIIFLSILIWAFYLMFLI